MATHKNPFKPTKRSVAKGDPIVREILSSMLSDTSYVETKTFAVWPASTSSPIDTTGAVAIHLHMKGFKRAKP